MDAELPPVMLVKDGVIGSLLLMAMGLLLIFSFGWNFEAGARVIALVSSGLWGYVLVGQLFVIRAHVQGEIRTALGIHDTPTLIDAPELERYVPVHHAAHSRITPVAVAPAPREIELSDGTRLPREDVIAFVDGLDTRGHMRKDWVGYRLPSGKVIDTTLFQNLIAAVRVTGEFSRYGQGIRSKRSMTTSEIKQRLHLD